MRSWVFAASLMAAAVTTGAQAADLDEGPPPDRYGSAYDDPRYADIYKYPRPPAYVAPMPTGHVVADLEKDQPEDSAWDWMPPVPLSETMRTWRSWQEWLRGQSAQWWWTAGSIAALSLLLLIVFIVMLVR